MEITLEVIVAIVALLVSLPPSIFVVWRCLFHYRAKRETS